MKMIPKNKNKINISSCFNTSFKPKIIKGFTLIEILVVATIIGLLAGGGVLSYSQFARQSRDAKRKADLEQIRAALEMYRSNNNQYAPYIGNCSSYQALTTPTRYIQSMPFDPKSSSGYFYYCNISTNDYTLGAALETSTTACVPGQCGSNCTYCVGPYGQR